MKTSTLKSLVRPVLFIMGFALLTSSFYGCVRKINFQNSQVVPAARGYVKVDMDDNKNYVVKLHIDGLAEVERLNPPRKSYVVWVETDSDETVNMGRITSSTGGMSKSLKANFEGITPSKPHKVFITAEDDEATHYPGNQIVLTTNGF